MLQNMTKILEYLNNTFTKESYNSISGDIFNTFIDTFLAISNNLSDSISYAEHKNIEEQLSNHIVDFVKICNEGNFYEARNVFTDMRNSFLLWGERVLASVSYEVIVCCSADSNPAIVYDLALQIIGEKAEIIAYVYKSNTYIGSHYNKCPIISINEAYSLDSDVILTWENEDFIIKHVENNVIFNYLKFTETFGVLASVEFFSQFYDFQLSSKQFEGIITGLSYSLLGVDANKLEKRFHNLAGPGQDLFYDFQMITYALSYPELANSLKYVLIGLSYYSFHYDLSKSVNENRVNYYYPITGTMHNYERQIESKDVYNRSLEIVDKILRNGHSLILYQVSKNVRDQLIDWSNEYCFDKLSAAQQEEEVKTIKKDFNKHYPLTLEENKDILRQYLDLLNKKNIKPIVFVCPTTTVYQQCCPEKLESEFLSFIGDLGQDYSFQFLDYFRSAEFSDEEDFQDSSHLNIKGREKLTLLLNKDIAW